MGSHTSTAPPGAAKADLTDRGKAKNNKQKGQNDVLQLDTRTLLRRTNLARQAADILRSEVQLTAQLVRNMNRNDPNRANALMRLAESLQELGAQETSAAQDLNERIFAANTARNAAQVAQLTRDQAAHNNQARDYRTQMLRVFETLISDHPNFPRMDAVMFYAAFAYQESRNMDRARAVYLALIQRFPQSQYVPNAYLSFAEFFFEQGDMDSAAQFYGVLIAITRP